jgi:hypothetical protein
MAGMQKDPPRERVFFYCVWGIGEEALSPRTAIVSLLRPSLRSGLLLRGGP